MPRASVGRSGALNRLPTSSHVDYAKKTIESSKRMNEIMTKWLKGLEDATADNVETALRETIMAYSLELVPYHTGRLHDSNFVERRKYTRGTEVVFGYAKNGYPHYASFVHEATWMHFSKGVGANRNEKRGAKYLERAVNEKKHHFVLRLKELEGKIPPPGKVGSRGMFGKAG